jgi:signal transduction histidine kinase
MFGALAIHLTIAALYVQRSDVVQQSVVFFGTINSLLLGMFAWLAMRIDEKAKALAAQMSNDIERKNEELLAAINSYPGMVSWVSRDLKYLGVNFQLAQSFGKSPKDFVGNPIGAFNGNGGGDSFRNIVEKAFQSQKEHSITEYSFEVGGEEKTFLTSMQTYNHGESIMIVSIDITDNKKLAKEIEDAKAKAEHTARLSSLGEMAGGMAHEINNPLTIIYAKANMLKRQIKPGVEIDIAKVQEGLDKIEKTADRISKIIKGLRSVSRDGESDPFQPASVQSIVADTAELCRARLNNKDVRFDYPKNIDPHFEIDCRSTQIIQVLLNLINNSFDALADLNLDRWIKLEVTAEPDGKWVQFSVTDSGFGIPENVQKRLMQPFYTTKAVGKGTGLGLSISKGIAESHGGYLKLDETCKNTRFILRLPTEHAEVQGVSKNRAA